MKFLHRLINIPVRHTLEKLKNFMRIQKNIKQFNRKTGRNIF